jgi:C-terminal processing protease CtpA/Prc
VILVDDVSMSQAEFTAMAILPGARALVIGSTTTGADGDISSIALPGGLRAAVSALAAFFAGRRPTQRAGILPNILVKPGIADIRAGRSPALERALSEIRVPRPHAVGIASNGRGILRVAESVLASF